MRHWKYKRNELKNIKVVLSDGLHIRTGDSMNERLESEFAKLHNMPFAVTANSGTSTLHMALKAFGIGPGDEVIIPALTVGMCGFVIVHCGAIPIYADVLPDTFLMDPDDVEKKITAKTKAILPVHIYGLMCNMQRIREIAVAHQLRIVEDCAQCFLAQDDKGRWCGTIGDVGSWSFESSKHMSCGEGGIVLTRSEDLAMRMRKFGGLGFKNLTAKQGKTRIAKEMFQDPNWQRHDIIGLNYRLAEPLAAIALAQLERLPDFVCKRRKMAEFYDEVIKETGSKLLIPQQKTGTLYTHSYYTYGAIFCGGQYGIQWKDFRKKYLENGGDGIYAAWKLVKDEPAFWGIGRGEVPVAERLQKDLMQFTTNQGNQKERDKQALALYRTLTFFGK